MERLNPLRERTVSSRGDRAADAKRMLLKVNTVIEGRAVLLHISLTTADRHNLTERAAQNAIYHVLHLAARHHHLTEVRRVRRVTNRAV